MVKQLRLQQHRFVPAGDITWIDVLNVPIVMDSAYARVAFCLRCIYLL
jgi:hypothetical protein